MSLLLRRLTAAFVIVAGLCWPYPASARVELTDDAALRFRTIDGRTVSLEDLRGQLVLVDFWATWCAPCLAELPRLRELHEKFGGRLTIVGVNLDVMERRRFVSWIRRNGVTWPQVQDGRGYNGELARRFAIDSLPATLLFDGEGRLIARDLRGDRLVHAVTATLDTPQSTSASPTPARRRR